MKASPLLIFAWSAIESDSNNIYNKLRYNKMP